jgi:cell division protein FtsB
MLTLFNRQNSPHGKQAESMMKMSRNRLGYTAAVLIVVGYAVVTLSGPKGLPALLAKRQQIEQLEKRNAMLAQENERLREHIQRLADNPAQQELEIRQRLKLVHPDEKVYLLNNNK